MSLKAEKTEQCQGYTIRVIAERRTESSSWTITVIVESSDGTSLPPRRNSDESFSSLDEAFSNGISMGKNIVNGRK